MRLLALAHETDYPLAKDLSDLFGSLERDLREGIGADQIDAGARVRRRDRRPPGRDAAPDGARTIGRFIELLDLADAFCREERLLVAGPHPRAAALPALVPRRVRPPGARRGAARRGTDAPVSRVGTEQRLVTTGARRRGCSPRWPSAARSAPCARWALSELVPDGAGFPWTTFAINVVGSFALALLPALARRTPQPRAGRRRSAPGVLGGFTTLSAYSEQAPRAARRRPHRRSPAPTSLGTLAACLVAVARRRPLVDAAPAPGFDDEGGDE